jgi:hypothetical protein
MERDVLPLLKLIMDLMPRCLITDDNNCVFEPCCGNRAISSVFKIAGFKTIERDLYTTREKHDFLSNPLPENHFDFIVTNPPFAGKKKFLIRALETRKPFALFVPVDILFMSDMDKILEGHRILVFSPNKVPMFYQNGAYKRVGNVVWILVDFPTLSEGITMKYYNYN